MSEKRSCGNHVKRITTCFLFLHLLQKTIGSPEGAFSSGQINPERRLSERIVITKYGALRGFISTLPSRNLQPVEIFLGIPYATAPIGKLRFMPPVTPAHWSGVRGAHIPGPVCPQRLPDITNETAYTVGRFQTLTRLLPLLRNQSEDCLYLNIYAPESAGKERLRLPVVVFIHGESFEWNAGSAYDGSIFASYTNIVFITINYRLGVLGFLGGLGGRFRGNFGLMDQVAALRWVKENIEEFGGDPTNVTLMGHRQGAACVSALMISPMSKGLFHRAILQSGSIFSPWSMATNITYYSKRLANSLGCGNSQSDYIIECLRQKSYSELVAVGFDVPTHLTAFGPVIDGIVLPGDPTQLLSMPNNILSKYDLLFGVTKHEYCQFSRSDLRYGLDIQRKEKILRTLVRNLFSFHLQEIFLTILTEYSEIPSMNSKQQTTFETVVEMLSDATIVAPLMKFGELHSRHRRKHSYFYTFMHSTQQNHLISPMNSCVQNEDLSYVFGATLMPGLRLGYFGSRFNRIDALISESVMSYWANFIRKGNPNSEVPKSSGTDEDKNSAFIKSASVLTIGRPYWPAFDESESKYLSIASRMEVKSHYRAHKLSFWLKLVPKLHLPCATSTTSGHGHLLSDFDKLDSYDGIVRNDSFSFTFLVRNPSSDGESVKSKSLLTTESHPAAMINFTHINNLSLSSAASSLLPSAPSTEDVGVHQLETTVSSSLGGGGNVSDKLWIGNETEKRTEHQNNFFRWFFTGKDDQTRLLSLTMIIGSSFMMLNLLCCFTIVFQARKCNRRKDAVSEVLNGEQQEPTNRSHPQSSTTFEANRTYNSTDADEDSDRRLLAIKVANLSADGYINSVTGGKEHQLLDGLNTATSESFTLNLKDSHVFVVNSLQTPVTNADTTI